MFIEKFENSILISTISHPNSRPSQIWEKFNLIVSLITLLVKSNFDHFFRRTLIFYNWKLFRIIQEISKPPIFVSQWKLPSRNFQISNSRLYTRFSYVLLVKRIGGRQFPLERRLQWSDDIFFFAGRYCRVNPIKRHERAATHDVCTTTARETRTRTGEENACSRRRERACARGTSRNEIVAGRARFISNHGQ